MHTCKRCKHQWRPRQDDAPVQCPHCRSPYWDRERIRDSKSNTEAGGDRQPPATLSKDEHGHKSGKVGDGTACASCGALKGGHQKWCKEK